MKKTTVLWIVDWICLLIFIGFICSLPRRLFVAPTSSVIEASNGELLSAAIAGDGQWRFPVADTLPEKFVKCITAYEDQRFFSHFGVDPVAMARAVKQNWKAKGVVSGGSTLTMQVIRLSRKKKRSLWQKMIEIWLAVRLEFTHSKTEIIGLYAANAPYGGNVVGLSAASWRYYGRKPEHLSWGEMATLAVLPNSPSLVHPGKNESLLIKKRNNLLDKLAKLQIIDQSTANLSKFEPIPNRPYPLPQHAPHLLNRFALEQQKLNVATSRLKSTIDYDLQLKVNDLLEQYQRRYQSNDINNIAALVVDVRSGAVKTYVGNTYQPSHPSFESHVDMIKAPRSPGSTLKPLLYASMLTDGFILPRTLIPDVPTQISGYVPQNYNLGYDGAIAADQALSRSLNIPAVKMLQQYKYERFYGQLKRLNFTTLNRPADHYGLSLILGGSEVTMWDLTRAYLGMARTLNHFNDYQGKYDLHDFDAPTYINHEVVKPKKEVLAQNSWLDHGAIWATFNAMEEVMRPGEEGLWEQFSSATKIAWKTGTSFGFRDAWAIGLTTDYIVCVWVGNADGEGRPGLTGIETAAPVLFDIFRELPTSGWFKTPKTKLSKMAVCKESGFKASEFCTTVKYEFVPFAGEKTALCPYHKLVHLSNDGNYRVTDDCESVANMKHQKWFVLPPTMEYYYKTKHVDYKLLPPFAKGCESNGTTAVMDMIYPKNNSIVYIPLELDGVRGKVVLTATHRDENIKIYWHIDGDYVGTTQSFHQLAAQPNPGKHTLTLVDENGERLVQVITVLANDKR